MKLNPLCIAAGILLGASGAVFAQSTASIEQSGNRPDASIDQDAPSGSALNARITQSAGHGNTARIEQRPDASGGAVQASATIDQRATGGGGAVLLQSGTTGSTFAGVVQEVGGELYSSIWQNKVHDSVVRSYQTGGASYLFIDQYNSSSAYAEAREADGYDSFLNIVQGDGSGGGVTNTQARVFQRAQDSEATLTQTRLENSSGYISQGSAERPGYYFSSLSNSWIEVDAGVAGGRATDSSARLSQSDGSYQTGYILQYGSSNTARVTQTGSHNTAGILQTGSGNYGEITQAGSLNIAWVKQYGDGDWASISQTGTSGIARITQR
jgi:hypothetical protein